MKQTDMRLGQIIRNVTRDFHEPHRLFFVTDEEMAMRLREFHNKVLMGEEKADE